MRVGGEGDYQRSCWTKTELSGSSPKHPKLSHQLDQAPGAGHYGYDRAGQLCWKGTNTGTKLDRACPTTPAGNTTIGRDLAGNSTNTTADPTVYNNHDQVTAIGGVSMGYRDLGNDLRKTAGATRMVSGPMGITATSNGSTVTFYTRDPQGTILNSHDTTGVRNYVTEYNGSVAALYNPSGAAVGSYKYTPYGTTTVAAETGGTTAAANPFRYISGYQDKTSSGADGYYKLGARYYDTRGHFTQPDPVAGGLADPRTLTRYNYAGGDPINHSDPSGYSFLDELGKAADFFNVISVMQKIRDKEYAAAISQSAGIIVGIAFGTGCIAVAGPETAGAAAPACVIGAFALGAGTESAVGAVLK